MVVGLLSLGLGAAVDGAAALFAAQPGLGWAMPVAGFAAFGLYRLLRVDFSWSTARVVKAAREGEEVPLRLAFAIIAGTALTILGGGSVGKDALPAITRICFPSCLLVYTLIFVPFPSLFAVFNLERLTCLSR